MSLDIDASEIAKPVRQFFDSLDTSEGPAVVRTRGRKFYVVARPDAVNQAPGPWTPRKAKRRHDLIDKQIDDRLTVEEEVELAELEDELDRYVDEVAPLPIEYARQVLDRLLRQAAAKKSKRKRAP
jgi:hypothetical protein